MITLRDLRRVIETAVRPVRQRVLMTVARGILEAVKDDGGIQLAKISLLKDEVRDDVERVQNFGFTSNPPEGSEIVAVFVGGNREHGFVIACDSRDDRLKDLASGESAMYTDTSGHLLALRSGGKFEIKNSTGELVSELSKVLEALVAEPFIVNKAVMGASKVIVDSMKV